MKEVQSKAELDKIVADGSPAILHFWASWCEASKHMDQVFSHLSTDFPHAHFLRVSKIFSLCAYMEEKPKKIVSFLIYRSISGFIFGYMTGAVIFLTEKGKIR